ncbi:MAG: N-acetyltransferase [Microbacteriaceae bacterium]|nr:N-acetyltransferase [Microbacteriaceae bacterium]
MTEFAAAGTVDRGELVALYESVGWSAYTKDPDKLVAAIAGSSTVVTAREGGELIGIARVVSDGASLCYLQDIIVRPDHQRFGIGRELVTMALAPYEHVRQKVLLTDDDPAQKAFYESLGYQQVAEPLRAFVRFD